MADREKVKELLNEITEYFRECRENVSFGSKEENHFWELQNAAQEAAELLKEQEAEWIEYPECLGYDGANCDSHIVCSACKHVFSIMDNCTEEFDYCPHCGAKMKQEGRRSDGALMGKGGKTECHI